VTKWGRREQPRRYCALHYTAYWGLHLKALSEREEKRKGGLPQKRAVVISRAFLITKDSQSLSGTGPFSVENRSDSRKKCTNHLSKRSRTFQDGSVPFDII